MSADGVRVAFGLPRLTKRVHTATIAGADLDAGPVTLDNVNGQIQVRCVNQTSGYMFEFFCEGGMGVLYNDPQNRWTVLEDGLYPTGVTRVYNAENDFTVVTPAPDSREYTFIFSPFKDIPMTVEKTAGAALAGEDIVLTLTYYRIRP